MAKKQFDADPTTPLNIAEETVVAPVDAMNLYTFCAITKQGIGVASVMECYQRELGKPLDENIPLEQWKIRFDAVMNRTCH